MVIGESGTTAGHSTPRLGRRNITQRKASSVKRASSNHGHFDQHRHSSLDSRQSTVDIRHWTDTTRRFDPCKLHAPVSFKALKADTHRRGVRITDHRQDAAATTLSLPSSMHAQHAAPSRHLFLELPIGTIEAEMARVREQAMQIVDTVHAAGRFQHARILSSWKHPQR